MDLAFTEEQDLLRETIRSLLGKYSSPEIVRDLEDTDPGHRPDLWEELGREVQILERHGQAADHPVAVSCLESNYLKCLIARVM